VVNGEQKGSRALEAAELQRRAISGSVWTVINTAVFVPVAFVANAIVARSLGVTSYGDLAFLTVALALATQAANLGFSNAFIQRGTRHEAAGRRREADELFRANLGFQLVFQVPLLLVIVTALTRGKPLWETVVLAGVVLVTGVFSGAPLSFTIENRTAAGAKLGLVMNVVVQVVAVAVAVSTKSASAVWVAAASARPRPLLLAVRFVHLGSRPGRSAGLFSQRDLPPPGLPPA
jgi:O-antigen/teichoic acid export membrane protein